MLQLNIITTKNDCYVSFPDVIPSYTSHVGMRFLFDGEKAEKSFHPSWLKIKKTPTKIELPQPPKKVNQRFELIDKDLASNKIPSVLKREEVAYYDEDELEWTWHEKYSTLESLYRYAEDEELQENEIVDFEIKECIEFDNIEEFKGFSYPTSPKSNVTDKNIKHQLIDEIVFPSIVLHERPCSISSVDAYNIIRQHVKNHIDGRYAKITSDYDFCFTVKKIIPLSAKEMYQVNVGKKKEKLETRYRDSREIQVFEMTNDKDNYKGYTAVKGFTGKNSKDLQKNIDTYLENLINEINSPLVDCKHCCGKGVVLNNNSK